MVCTVKWCTFSLSEDGDLRVSLFKIHAAIDDEPGQLFDSNLGKFDSFYLTGHYIFLVVSANRNK